LAGTVNGFTIGFNRFISAFQADEMEAELSFKKLALPVHDLSWQAFHSIF
jgi:hypothetical protein